MATIVAAAGGGTWATGGTWVGGVAPTASDDVQLTSSSGNVTIAANTSCRSLDCTGYTGTLTQNTNIVLTIGTTTPGASNIALKLVTGMTYTLGNTNSGITFNSSSGTQQTITTAGKTIGQTNFAGSGSYLLSDAYTTSGQFISAGTMTLDTGSNRAISCTNFLTSASSSPTLTLNGSSVTCTAASTNAVLLNGTPIFTAGTYTFVLNGATSGFNNNTATTLTFSTVNPSGSGAVTFAGTNIFTGGITVPVPGAARTITFPAGKVTTFGSWIVTGASAKLISLVSSTAGTAATLRPTAGATLPFSSDFLSVKDITVQDSAGGSGTGKWYAGANSTNVSGNTGWTFTAPPSTGSLSLSASVTAAAAATATGSLTLGGAATSAAAATATGSLFLTGTSSATAPASAAAALSLTGTGTPAAAATTTALLTLTGDGTATAPTAGSGQLSLTATASTQATTTSDATITLTGQAAGAAPVAGGGSLTFTGSSSLYASTGAVGAITLTGTGTALIPLVNVSGYSVGSVAPAGSCDSGHQPLAASTGLTAISAASSSRTAVSGSSTAELATVGSSSGGVT